MTADDVVAERLPETVREALLAPLFDHHSHPVRRDDLVRAQFEPLISRPARPRRPAPRTSTARPGWRSGAGAGRCSAWSRT